MSVFHVILRGKREANQMDQPNHSDLVRETTFGMVVSKTSVYTDKKHRELYSAPIRVKDLALRNLLTISGETKTFRWHRQAHWIR